MLCRSWPCPAVGSQPSLSIRRVGSSLPGSGLLPPTRCVAGASSLPSVACFLLWETGPSRCQAPQVRPTQASSSASGLPCQRRRALSALVPGGAARTLPGPAPPQPPASAAWSRIRSARSHVPPCPPTCRPLPPPRGALYSPAPAFHPPAVGKPTRALPEFPIPPLLIQQSCQIPLCEDSLIIGHFSPALRRREGCVHGPLARGSRSLLSQSWGAGESQQAQGCLPVE